MHKYHEVHNSIASLFFPPEKRRREQSWATSPPVQPQERPTLESYGSPRKRLKHKTGTLTRRRELGGEGLSTGQFQGQQRNPSRAPKVTPLPLRCPGSPLAFPAESCLHGRGWCPRAALFSGLAWRTGAELPWLTGSGRQEGGFAFGGQKKKTRSRSC